MKPIKNLDGFCKSLRYFGHDVLSSCKVNDTVFMVKTSFPVSIESSNPLHDAPELEDYISVVNYFHDLFNCRVCYLEVSFDMVLEHVLLYVSFHRF